MRRSRPSDESVTATVDGGEVNGGFAPHSPTIGDVPSPNSVRLPVDWPTAGKGFVSVGRPRPRIHDRLPARPTAGTQITPDADADAVRRWGSVRVREATRGHCPTADDAQHNSQAHARLAVMVLFGSPKRSHAEVPVQRAPAGLIPPARAFADHTFKPSSNSSI